MEGVADITGSLPPTICLAGREVAVLTITVATPLPSGVEGEELASSIIEQS